MRLEPLRFGTVKPVNKSEKEKVEKEWVYWGKKAGVRKKICMDLWGFCTELLGDGQTKEELWEELGVEGDE